MDAKTFGRRRYRSSHNSITIAGKNAVEAIEAFDLSENQGFGNLILNYITEYGYKTPGLEIFRRMLQQFIKRTNRLWNETFSYQNLTSKIYLSRRTSSI